MESGNFSGLKALFVNCTLKKSPRTSNTRGLMKLSMDIMEREGAVVDEIRFVDREVALGMMPDMTEDGYDRDEWPAVFQRILDADILVVGSPIWLGEPASVTRHFLERLNSVSAKLNEKGQSVFYGRTAGCVITGNEDGAKNCSKIILYALQHLGYIIPPQADAAWLGEVGPGPSYLDEDSGAIDHEFTNRNITIMTYNLLHIAALMKKNKGLPNYGNNREAWKNGERWKFKKLNKESV